MLTETEALSPTQLELQTAEAAFDEARRVWTAWSERRQTQTARAAAIGSQIAELDVKLAVARKAALSGSDGADVTALMAQRRQLEAEAMEAVEMTGVASSEESSARVTFEAASLEADRLRIVRLNERRVSEADQLDAEIDAAVGVLFELLERRAALMAGGGQAGLVPLPIRWEAMSHVRDPHGNVALPNARSSP